MKIRRAHPGEAELLTEIAHAAKRHWSYPESWIEQWKPDLTITREFIADNEVFVATDCEEILGCCALVITESVAELEHMWIRPQHMSRGVGRALFLHVTCRAATLNMSGLELSADPNAEGFYRRMGAVRVGENTSHVKGQPRVLPRMRVDLSSSCREAEFAS